MAARGHGKRDGARSVCGRFELRRNLASARGTSSVLFINLVQFLRQTRYPVLSYFLINAITYILLNSRARPLIAFYRNGLWVGRASAQQQCGKHRPWANPSTVEQHRLRHTDSSGRQATFVLSSTTPKVVDSCSGVRRNGVVFKVWVTAPKGLFIPEVLKFRIGELLS
jgi:hypothetical protein